MMDKAGLVFPVLGIGEPKEPDSLMLFHRAIDSFLISGLAEPLPKLKRIG